MNFDTHYITTASKLTLGSFFKVDEDQIIFPMVTNSLCFDEKQFLPLCHEHVTIWDLEIRCQII